MSILRRLPARRRSMETVTLNRVLPSALQRKVGPWVFFDHFGPAEVPAGTGMDVRPHPHCGLSTVSYLFEGAVEHRDSTGGHHVLRPGGLHWMRAGHGIVHSERTPAALRERPHRSHGLQLWCAHPDGDEDQPPRFDVVESVPTLDVEGVPVQLVAGEGWGQVAEVDVTSPLVFAIAHLSAGRPLALPDHEERAVYALSAKVSVDGDAAALHEMLVVDRGARFVRADGDAIAVIIGGDPIGHRHLWWNLVHSDFDRLEQQAQRWRDGGFPAIPGDDDTFIPAPAGPHRGTR